MAWNSEIRHFEITKCKIFLDKKQPPYNTQKSYTNIHLDKKYLKFGIFSSPIVEFPYARLRGHCSLATPKSYRPTLTNLNSFKKFQFWALKGPEIMHFTSPNTNCLMGGCCLEPLSRAKPLGPYRWAWTHSWVLVLHTRCFSLQAIHKSWKPWLHWRHETIFWITKNISQD